MLSKKRISEIRKEVEDMPLESVKTELDRYIKAIVRYKFTEAVTSGPYFNEMFHNSLEMGADAILENNISKKQKDRLHHELLPFFSEPQTEEQIRNDNIKYYKSLVSWAKSYFSLMPDEEKEKIIRDCLEQEQLSMQQSDRTYKVITEIEKLKKRNGPKKAKAYKARARKRK